MTVLRWTTGCFFLAALFIITSAMNAQERKATFFQEWRGSVEDADKEKLAPKSGFISNAKAFEALWKSWNPEAKLPTVDFKKHVVILATTVGSKLNLTTKIDGKGDLQVLAIATRDLRPGFRYHMATVSREGFKTINGQKVE